MSGGKFLALTKLLCDFDLFILLGVFILILVGVFSLIKLTLDGVKGALGVAKPSLLTADLVNLVGVFNTLVLLTGRFIWIFSFSALGVYRFLVLEVFFCAIGVLFSSACWIFIFGSKIKGSGALTANELRLIFFSIMPSWNI